MSTYMTKLLDHLAWADRLVLDGLRSSAQPHPRALALYAHVVGAEHVWLSRIRERAPRVAVWPELSLDEAEALAAENVAGLRALLAGLAPEDLGREIAYRTSAGDAFRSTIEDILLHVALHGAYHRGQIALVVRDAGGEPRPTDYIAFARGAPAATRAGAGSTAPGAA